MALTITEESGVHKSWPDEAKKVKTTDELSTFVNHLIDDYEHDYGTIIHAIFAASLAAYSVVEESPQGGITGFQASCLTWLYVEEFGMFSKDSPKRITDFDNLLYPQHVEKFTTISKSTWDYIEKKANENLQGDPTAHEDVIAHWKSISDGHVPFGLSIKPE